MIEVNSLGSTPQGYRSATPRAEKSKGGISPRLCLRLRWPDREAPLGEFGEVSVEEGWVSPFFVHTKVHTFAATTGDALKHVEALSPRKDA